MNIFETRAAALVLAASAAAALALTVAPAPARAGTGTGTGPGTGAPKLADLVRELKVDVMPTAEVRPGMKGYGLSVFSGIKIERFDIEVIGVIPGFLPKVPVVAFRMKHPVTDWAGVIGGMSGSPIFIVEGTRERVVGALAYGFPFGKDPIAFATPLEEMLKELDRPLRGPDVARRAPDMKPLAYLPTAVGAPAPFPSTTGGPFAPAPAPAPGSPAAAAAAALIEPVSIPLSVAGMAAPVLADLADRLAPYGIVPLAGGGSAAKGGPGAYMLDTVPKYEPGSAIGVVLFRGDMEGVGTGTVTWVKGSRILAFGHPMFNGGEAYMPITTAWIHMVLASISRSNKLSSPIAEIGSLEEDRNTCIIGDVTKKAPMVPMQVTIHDVGRAGKSSKVYTFKTDLLAHRLFTPLYALTAIQNALWIDAADIDDAVYSMKMTVKLAGHKEVTMYDDFYSPIGPINRNNLDRSRIMRGLNDIVNNVYEPVSFERFDVEFDVKYSPDFGTLQGAFLDRAEVHAGDRVNLNLIVRRFGEKDEVRVVPVTIPAGTGGSELKVTVEGGHDAKGVTAEPESLDDILLSAAKGYPGNSVVVTMTLPEAGVKFAGKVVPAVPTTVLDALDPSSSSIKGKTYRHVLESTVPMPDLVIGKTELTILVTEDLR